MPKLKHTLSLLSILLILISASFAYLHQLPNVSNHWFTASGGCVLCHSTSTYSMLDSNGIDVSPVARWRGTMLANASKDPFWKAKVKHEGLVNPDHREALEGVCTRCHAPMGMMNAFLSSGSNYSLDSLASDPVGRDGISCTLCHQINDFSFPDFSGHFSINDQKFIYGPYENPLIFQMFTNTGYTPKFGDHINDSRLCGACHSLFTHSVDEQGVLTGKTFIEQALYHEWENSVYGVENITCQSCHLPRIYENVKISSRPGILEGRTPYGVHNFTGGNYFMLSLLKENHDRLELNSGEEFIARSMERTKELLTQNTIHLSFGSMVESEDSIFIEVVLENMAGHKFPTGFPSRRAYLEFMAFDAQDTLFHSGKAGSPALTNTNPLVYEPHHVHINRDDQVQMYEFVMGDIRGKVTTVLERAYEPLKDNRIVPTGFSKDHYNYDTVKVVGRAVYDSDYFSGRGTERLMYALSKEQVASATDVRVNLHYETVPENWLHEMFSFANFDADIELFRSMYLSSDRTPVLIASANLQLMTTQAVVLPLSNVKVYPNPTAGKVWLSGLQKSSEFELYTITGSLIRNGFIDAANAQLDLEVPPGTYILKINSAESELSQKIMVF